MAWHGCGTIQGQKGWTSGRGSKAAVHNLAPQRGLCDATVLCMYACQQSGHATPHATSRHATPHLPNSTLCLCSADATTSGAFLEAMFALALASTTGQGLTLPTPLGLEGILFGSLFYAAAALPAMAQRPELAAISALLLRRACQVRGRNCRPMPAFACIVCGSYVAERPKSLLLRCHPVFTLPPPHAACRARLHSHPSHPRARPCGQVPTPGSSPCQPAFAGSAACSGQSYGDESLAVVGCTGTTAASGGAGEGLAGQAGRQ